MTPVFIGDRATGGGKYDPRGPLERERKSAGPGAFPRTHDLYEHSAILIKHNATHM